MRNFAALAVLVVGLSGCAYSGDDIGNPAIRKFQWFSFVAGDDIKRTCAIGTPDRYRLVYNAVYDKQLRIYQIDSLRKILDVKVTDSGDLSRFDAADPAAPWRAKEAKVQLDEAEFKRLVDDFSASGMFGPPSLGLELPSRSYFWAAALCRDGRFSMTGWKYPSAQFDQVKFAATLFALDATEIPPAAAAPIAYDPQIEDDLRRGERTAFTLKIGENGLVR